MTQTKTPGTPHQGQVTAMKSSGWLTFSGVVLIVAGILRVIDAIWAFGYNGLIPYGLRGALLGHTLTTYGWIWLITGVILIAAGLLVLGPGDRPSAETSRWVGIRGERATPFVAPAFVDAAFAFDPFRRAPFRVPVPRAAERVGVSRFEEEPFDEAPFAAATVPSPDDACFRRRRRRRFGRPGSPGAGEPS